MEKKGFQKCVELERWAFLDTFQTLMKVSCGVDKGVGPPAYIETF